MAAARRAGSRFLIARDIGSSGGANVHFFGRRRGFDGGGGVTMPRALLEDPSPAPAPAMMDAPATTTTGRGPAAASRVTPAVLFVTVVLAVVLLVSALLHVLRRLFLKTHHGSAQHLFFPAAHDDGAGGSGSCSGGGGGGLSQAAIDALPEFAYGELSSRKGKEKAARPFDCAVCLCEFADHDRLRLLPTCGHAFHAACIDVWLRSTATCPLCRTKLKLSARHLAAAAADAAPSSSVGATDVEEQDSAPPDAAEAASSSVVLPVRLGRFKNADADADEAESSSSAGLGATSRIDRRRCYSMGSCQYVLADEHLLVSVHLRHGNAGGSGVAAASSGDEQHQGKKVFARGDSFSVSKIWQWRGSKRLPGALCADDGLPWAPAAKDDRSCQREHEATQRHLIIH